MLLLGTAYPGWNRSRPRLKRLVRNSPLQIETMFKYLLAIAVCLICLVLLQQGCKGFGERFRKRIDERKQQRQERWGEWQQRHENRRDPNPNEEPNGDRKHFFRHHWQRRRERSDANNDDISTILIEDQ